MKNQIQPNLPAWHNNPLRLTKDEIDHPFRVVRDFFIIYKLISVRSRLRSVFLKLTRKKEIDFKEHVLFYEDVDKLIEAVWVINNLYYEELNKAKKKKRKGKTK